MNINEIKENFLILESEEKLTYLIELSTFLPEFPENKKTFENQVVGCASKTFINITKKDNVCYFDFKSDAKIINGILYIIYLLLNGKDVNFIKKFDFVNFFTEIGILNIISHQRQTGFYFIIEKIQNI